MLEVAQSNVNEMQKQHKNALAKLQTEKIAVSVELPLLETGKNVGIFARFLLNISKREFC